MLCASYVSYPLHFKRPSGTSRGVLNKKPSYLLKIWNADTPDTFGIGEASIIPGLSIDNPVEMENKLEWLCQNIQLSQEKILQNLVAFPAILMAYEMAQLDLRSGGKRIWFNAPIIKHQAPIRINGLIWMGDVSYMLSQIEQKLSEGFKCLKLKIGALNFEDELNVIKKIRERYDDEELEIRVDANGAFSPNEAMEKLNRLADLDLHSIEQPIKQGQVEEMYTLCEKTPLSIALDEELIGITTPNSKTKLLEDINPQYIILKPSLLGGFIATYEWIQAAGELSIPWWITSALESNVGLAAIAQFTSQFYNPLPQGLGTGQLYTNNISSPLVLKGDLLSSGVDNDWSLPKF